MLKKVSRLFLGLVVCAGSACVTPTHASSADFGFSYDIIITRIQASGEFGAKDEYVVLHNNSAIQADISDWCLMNKSRVLFACFVSKDEAVYENFYVPPYGDIVVVSSDYAAARSSSPNAYTLIYDVTNNSSGSIVNSSDEIMVIDIGGGVINVKAWESSIATGKIHARNLLTSGPDIYANTQSPSDWSQQNRLVPPLSSVVKVTHEKEPDEPVNPEPIPEVDQPSEGAPLSPVITEILANPSGVDTAGEFIELYNPNDHTLRLSNFTVLIGTSPKVYTFPANASIPPLSYVAFSDADMGYTLVNTTGKVQLSKDDHAVGDAIEYVSPKDDYSWALVDGVWQYIKPASPGAANQWQEKEDEELVEVTEPKPCVSNQFRNPETGRCKLLSSAVSTPAPCKPNQERSPLTNRCRNLVTSTQPAPCKEGQERNPETNRCRNIVKISEVGHALGVQTKADAAMSWYYWAAIIAIMLLIVGYAIWEWREELVGLWARIRLTFAKHSD